MRRWGQSPAQWREWSEEDRELALHEYRLVCPKCGNLRAECSDPKRNWFGQESRCYATAALEVFMRHLLKEHPGQHEYPGRHALDGLTPWVSMDDVG